MVGVFKNIISLLKEWLLAKGVAPHIINTVIEPIAGFFLLVIIIYYVYILFNKVLLWNRKRLLKRDLHPFFTDLEVRNATRYYIDSNYQNVAPSQDDEPGRRYIASARNKLIPMFINKAFKDKKEDDKYYIILADSGMGKTTFMINLLLKYKYHLTWKSKSKIMLLPLGNPNSLLEVENLSPEEQSKTILLLDAFDEDIRAIENYKERLGEILKTVWRFREVVITCRTQFFPTRDEEPYETGFYRYGGEAGEFKFQKLYLSVFDDKDVKKYLRQRYNLMNPLQWSDYRKARQIVRKSPNLMIRPMLLSHIGELVKENKTYVYSYQIYEVLIDKWIKRESRKHGIKSKYGSEEKFRETLLQFSQQLAVNLFQRKDERKGLYINQDEKIDDVGIQMSDFEEDTDKSLGKSSLRTRSLLNRNTEGQYKFSHKSILEYFLAKEAIENVAFYEKLDFQGMDAAENFFEEMFFEKILRRAEGTYSLINSKKEFPLGGLSGNINKSISSIEITNAKKVPLQLFKHISSLSPDGLSLRSITFYDKSNFSTLYSIYQYYIELIYYEDKLENEMEELVIESQGFIEEIEQNIIDMELGRAETLELYTELKNPQGFEEYDKRVNEYKKRATSLMINKRKLNKTKIISYNESIKKYKSMRLICLQSLESFNLIELINRLKVLENMEIEDLKILKLKLKEPQITEEFNENQKDIYEIEKLYISNLDESINCFIIQCRKIQEALPSVRIYY